MHGVFLNAHSALVLSIQHERWSAWQVIENRAQFYWLFTPRAFFSISFGIAYRNPILGAVNLGQSLFWAGISPELGIVFRVEAEFFSIGPFSLRGLIYNFDRMRLETSDNVHLGLVGRFRIADGWWIQALGSQGIKGVSGGILSFGQNELLLEERRDLRQTPRWLASRSVREKPRTDSLAPKVEQRVKDSLALTAPTAMSPVSPTAFKIAAFGDPQIRTENVSRMAAFKTLVTAQNIEFFIVMGDLTEDADTG